MTVPTVPTTTAQTAPGSPMNIKFEHLMALFACVVLLVSVVYLVDRPPINERTDFSVTYLGSRMVYLGLGTKLYDLSEQQKLKKPLLPDAEPLIYEHPPFEALLLSPLGALPYKTAYLLWGLVNVAIWLVLPYLLRPYISTPRDDAAYLLLWLLFLPMWAALFEGQSSLVMLLLYSINFIQFKRGRDFWAGVVFGLALLKFQFAIPFVVILILQKKWRFMQGFLTTTGVLGVLSLVAVGWRGIVGYINLLKTIAAHPESASYGNAVAMATVGGFVNSLLGRALGHAATSLVVAGGSIFLLVWAASRWKKAGFAADQRTFDLMFAVAVVVSLTTSLHMFTPDLSPLLLPMLLVTSYFPTRSQTWLRIVMGTTLVMFWMPPLFFLLLARHLFYLWFPVMMLFIIGIFKLAEISPERVGMAPISNPAVSSS